MKVENLYRLCYIPMMVTRKQQRVRHCERNGVERGNPT